MRARAGRREDANAIVRIYNGGIEDRLATFETRPRNAKEVEGWFAAGFPLVVVERAGELVAGLPRRPIARRGSGTRESPSSRSTSRGRNAAGARARRRRKRSSSKRRGVASGSS